MHVISGEGVGRDKAFYQGIFCRYVSPQPVNQEISIARPTDNVTFVHSYVRAMARLPIPEGADRQLLTASSSGQNVATTASPSRHYRGTYISTAGRDRAAEMSQFVATQPIQAPLVVQANRSQVAQQPSQSLAGLAIKIPTAPPAVQNAGGTQANQSSIDSEANQSISALQPNGTIQATPSNGTIPLPPSKKQRSKKDPTKKNSTKKDSAKDSAKSVSKGPTDPVETPTTPHVVQPSQQIEQSQQSESSTPPSLILQHPESSNGQQSPSLPEPTQSPEEVQPPQPQPAPPTQQSQPATQQPALSESQSPLTQLQSQILQIKQEPQSPATRPSPRRNSIQPIKEKSLRSVKYTPEVGDVVSAKVSGNPAWPAQVSLPVICYAEILIGYH